MKMNEIGKLVRATIVLIILAVLPGLIGFWTFWYSMAAIVILGVGALVLERQGRNRS